MFKSQVFALVVEFSRELLHDSVTALRCTARTLYDDVYVSNKLVKFSEWPQVMEHIAPGTARRRHGDRRTPPSSRTRVYLLCAERVVVDKFSTRSR